MHTGIDTTDSVLGKGKELKAAGIDFVIKYSQSTHNFPHKAMTAAELHELRACGIKVGVAFEQGNTIDVFTEANGIEHGKIALAHCQSLECPANCGPYFAVDLSVDPADFENVAEYFAGVRSIVRPHLMVNAYVQWDFAQYMLAKGLIHNTWLPNASKWGDNYKIGLAKADIVQTLDKPPLGLNADINHSVSLAGLF